jgi:hypothetical protein
MDLLDFARGPALYGSIAVFVGGTAWRLAGLWRRPAQTDLSPPREGAPGRAAGAWQGIVRGMWPRRAFGQNAMVTTFNGYVLHIGLALTFLAYAPHIDFVRRLVGVGWPALPDPVMYLAAAASMISLLMALVFRLTDPVLKRISRADDLVTWTVTFLPFITGMAVVGGTSASILARGEHVIYRGPLALHLLALELLLIWFPFGKLMHAFLVLPSRMQLAGFFGRRGVRS